jgi:hypothetical protein
MRTGIASYSWTWTHRNFPEIESIGQRSAFVPLRATLRINALIFLRA